MRRVLLQHILVPLKFQVNWKRRRNMPDRHRLVFLRIGVQVEHQRRPCLLDRSAEPAVIALMRKRIRDLRFHHELELVHSNRR